VKIQPARLAAELERRLHPVYLFAGPERLIVEEAADQVRRACRAHDVVERIRLSADGRFDWGDLSRATETASLFATRRLVEIRLPTGKPGTEGGKALRAWVEQDRDDVLMLLADQWELAQEKSAWFKALDAAGLFIAAWAVKPAQLPRWIDQRLTSRGLSADASVARFLAERLEGNLLAAAQEVDRLALLFPGARLTLAQVREAVADNARFDSFRLVELSLTGQAGAALRCIRGLRETEVAPAAVIWAVGREVEVAWQVAVRRQPAAQTYRELQVWPSRQGPIEACIHRLGASRLEALIPRLSRLDRLAKGQAEGAFWVELERFCVALAQTPGRRAA